MYLRLLVPECRVYSLSVCPNACTPRRQHHNDSPRRVFPGYAFIHTRTYHTTHFAYVRKIGTEDWLVHVQKMQKSGKFSDLNSRKSTTPGYNIVSGVPLPFYVKHASIWPVSSVRNVLCLLNTLRRSESDSAHFERSLADFNSADPRLMFITATTVGYGETWVTTHLGRYEIDRLTWCYHQRQKDKWKTHKSWRYTWECRSMIQLGP